MEEAFQSRQRAPVYTNLADRRPRRRRCRRRAQVGDETGFVVRLRSPFSAAAVPTSTRGGRTVASPDRALRTGVPSGPANGGPDHRSADSPWAGATNAIPRWSQDRNFCKVSKRAARPVPSGTKPTGECPVALDKQLQQERAAMVRATSSGGIARPLTRRDSARGPPGSKTLRHRHPRAAAPGAMIVMQARYLGHDAAGERTARSRHGPR